MLVTYPNNVKIYNLSAGKSLPEWLTDRKRRKLLQDDVELRRRIELIQDFDMPDCSNYVCMSRNGEYIFVCGTYKPRVKCFEVNHLSMKFERCMDAEPIKALVLSDSYDKVIFLQEERWVEFHVQYGRYFRLRIPKFGRDIAYNETNCDLYIVGSGPDAYRLNLEQGRFMTSFTTSASSLTRCVLNSEQQLLMLGTIEGSVEAWDPRARTCAATLDTAKALISENIRVMQLPAVTSLAFKNGMQMAVGTATGQILLYDIRSNKPYLVKDHNSEMPILNVEFGGQDPNLVISMDRRMVKLWQESDNGKPYTSVEPGVDLNSMCLVPKTGLFFLANENEKVLTYYIPSLGPAPRWCSFLDNITEELEETDQPEVYDDYKFLTTNELEEIGLSHLVGSKLLRAYMHGFFIDARLYNKAKALTNPLAFEEYKKQKVRDQIDKERSNRVQIKKLPDVNRLLAQRLTLEEAGESANDSMKAKKLKSRRQASAALLLNDDRFKALFEKSEFEIDPQSDEFKLLNPALARLDKQKTAKKPEPETEDLGSDVEHDHLPVDNESEASSSSEDDNEYREQVKLAHKEINERRYFESKIEREEARVAAFKAPKSFKITSGDNFQGWAKELTKPKDNAKDKSESLERRLAKSTIDDTVREHAGSREMTFSSKKLLKQENKERKMADHVRDRRKVRRSTAVLNKKKR